MTAFVDQIEDAFIAGRNVWQTEDAVNLDALTQVMRTNGIEADTDGVLVAAFLASRRKWGNDWHAQTGDVAEQICYELVCAGIVQAHHSQPC